MMQGSLAPVWRHYNTLTLQYDISDHPDPEEKTYPLPLDLFKEYVSELHTALQQLGSYKRIMLHHLRTNVHFIFQITYAL